MNRIKLLFSVTLMLFATQGLWAQVWMDAFQNTQKPGAPMDDYATARKNSFINFTYASFSFAHEPLPGPAKDWGPLKDGSGPKWGAMMEFGTLRFYGDNFMLQNRGNLGLYLSNGLGVVFYDFKVPPTTQGPKIPFMLVDLKLGPVFRYFITDKLITDFYLNAGGIFAAGGLVGNSDSPTYYEPTRLGLGFQMGTGLNIEYGVLSLGAQFTFARSDMGFKITEDPAYYGPQAPEELEITYPRVKLNSFRVHLGFIIPRN